MEKYLDFPKGYAHLEKRFSEMGHRIGVINNTLDSLPKADQPKPRFDMDQIGISKPISYQKMRGDLESERATLQTAIMDMARDAVVGADNKVAKEIMDKSEMIAFPGIYENQSRAQMEQSRSEKKNIDQSTDFLRETRFNHKLRIKELLEEEKPERARVFNQEKKIITFLETTNYPKRGSETKSSEKDKAQDKDENTNKSDPFHKSEEAINNFFNSTSIDFSKGKSNDSVREDLEPEI